MDESLIPDWPAPANVRALMTLRRRGCSRGAYADFNLADHVGDDPVAVVANRARLRGHLPAEPLWLTQVHGTRCVLADAPREVPLGAASRPGVEADASVSFTPGTVCAVLTADCLPVLFCDVGGTVVAAAHAGWRGLAAGVLESTVAAMRRPPADILAWLGPAIGPAAFEVGDEVRAVFVAHDSGATAAFKSHGEGKWLCDLHELARRRLTALGIHRIASADFCTVTDAERFYSYRRDGATGRMASLVWLDRAV
ncbi:MAG: peptidoglycan editing factor PgeF [Sulfurisoma sp.]|nr:peptidoglycan editing factor PgeF [Sulfurisoma sp.]